MKWSLHAREEIVFELLLHLRGNTTRGFARRNDKEHQGNDSRAGSSSWTLIYHSSCHAEHSPCMVAGSHMLKQTPKNFIVKFS